MISEEVEYVSQCPVCKSTVFEEFLTCTDYTVSQENFFIVQCQQCAFKFTNPRPTEKAIAPYYESNAYASHHASNKNSIDVVYRTVRKQALRNKLGIVNERHPQKGNLLDVGCGTGMFLKTCNQNGWRTYGVEPDSDARQLALQTSHSQVRKTIFEIDEEQAFDVITLWHVLEHVHRLDETIIKIKQLLKDESTLIVAVPNSNSLDSQQYRRYWAAYDVPRHLYHFSPETLQQLFKRHGLTVRRQVPMKFDAYYICLLSEKYKNQKISYLKAIRDGYRSNKWASDHDNNYSSLTYILTK